MKQKGDKSNYTAQKMKFSIKFPQFPADLVTFTEENLWKNYGKIFGKIMENFIFLSSASFEDCDDLNNLWLLLAYMAFRVKSS